MPVQDEVFGFFIPSVTLMGVGSRKEIGEQIKLLGSRKPLICTDREMVAAGISSQVVTQIQKMCGVNAIVYEDPKPGPMNISVEEGLGLYQRHQCDLILSLGGTSAHDCGKGIGIVATNGGNLRDYSAVDQSLEAMPTFIPFMIRPLASKP